MPSLPRALAAPLCGLLLAAACNRVETELARPGGARVAPDAPSVLLISIDTLRADRVGVYGSDLPTTPHLDGLAAAGVRFETAIAPAPLTLPSHATLLTGLLPPRHGVRHNGIFRLRDDAETLAERFSAAGFATGAVVGAMVLDARFGLAQGFDHYDATFGDDRASATGYSERRAEQVTEAALAWLDGAPGPFFLFVHYYDPHADFRAPPDFEARFPGRPYEAEVAYTDAALGALLEGLEQRGRRERTLVVATSDHGESLGEHGEHTHGYGLYDATLRVPLVLAGPGVPAGETLGGVVSLASVAPTVLGLAGLPALAETDGEDLARRWRAGGAGQDAAYAAAYAETLATRLDHGWAPLHALRTDAHLYVRAPRAELYDIGADPRQRHNLLPGPEAEAVAAPLDARLEALLAAAAPLETHALDAETLGQLHALGYAVRDQPAPETGLDPKDGLRFVETYVRARTALFEGDLATAETLADELLEGQPGSPQVHMLKATLQQTRGRPDLALPHAEHAARLLPESAAFQAQLGDLRLALRDVAGAVRAYEAALAVDPNFAEAQAGAMWKAAAGGSLEEAERHAAAAVALRPDDVALRTRVAESWDRMGAPEQALRAYREILEVGPDASRAHAGIAIQLARLGRGAEAEEHLSRAGELGLDANLQSRLAIAFAAAGDVARAEAVFRGVLSRHPEHEGARRNLAHLLRSQGREADLPALDSAAP